MNHGTIQKKVNSALKKLREQDLHIIKNNSSERSITHMLAIYLKDEFSTYSVDCEYNRQGDIIKHLEVPRDKINWDDLEAKTVFPDIIIHQRGSDDDNLLVIEVKKSSNQNGGAFDKVKLKAFRKDPFNYKHSLFLKIDVDSDKDILEWD